MGKYHKIEDMLVGELMKIGAEGKLSNTSLEVGDKAAHFLKSIKTIEAMEDEDERSYRYDGMYRDGYDHDSESYARGRGRYARRDTMGRYADGRMDGMRSGNKNELMREIEEMKRQLEHMED